MIDINNPDHVSALRWAIDLKSKAGAKVTNPGLCATIMARVANPPHKWAFEALSSPVSAAELIRQLAKRAGLPVRNFYSQGRDVFASVELDDTYIRVEIVNHFVGKEPTGHTFKFADVAQLVSRLLILDTNAGPVEVLQALRGES